MGGERRSVKTVSRISYIATTNYDVRDIVSGFHFFQDFFTVFFMDNGEDDDIMRYNAIICPETAAAQAVKGRAESSQFFDPAFAKG